MLKTLLLRYTAIGQYMFQTLLLCIPRSDLQTQMQHGNSFYQVALIFIMISSVSVLKTGRPSFVRRRLVLLTPLDPKTCNPNNSWQSFCGID